jgi:hypothetical protein
MIMHPEIMRQIVEARLADVRRDNARRQLLASRSRRRPITDLADVALRLCRVSDDGAISRLAALEERPEPHGRFVVAEVDGEIVAALPLAGGAPLRDPFARTAHLIRLLEMRAAQLMQDEREPRHLWPRRLGFARNSTHA